MRMLTSKLIEKREAERLVPQKLREFVGISKRVMIIGFSNHAEIWDIDKYNAVEAEELSLENIAEAWKELGI